MLQHMLTPLLNLILFVLRLDLQQGSPRLRVGRFGLNGLGCRPGRIPKCTSHSQTSAAVPNPHTGEVSFHTRRSCAALSAVASAVGKSAETADSSP